MSIFTIFSIFLLGPFVNAFLPPPIIPTASHYNGLQMLDKDGVIDKESLDLVNNAYNDAKTILLENKALMNNIIEELLKKNTLYGKDVMKILENKE